jgi:hypothetical protein
MAASSRGGILSKDGGDGFAIAVERRRGIDDGHGSNPEDFAHCSPGNTRRVRIRVCDTLTLNAKFAKKIVDRVPYAGFKIELTMRFD